MVVLSFSSDKVPLCSLGWPGRTKLPKVASRSQPSYLNLPRVAITGIISLFILCANIMLLIRQGQELCFQLNFSEKLNLSAAVSLHAAPEAI